MLALPTARTRPEGLPSAALGGSETLLHLQVLATLEPPGDSTSKSCSRFGMPKEAPQLSAPMGAGWLEALTRCGAARKCGRRTTAW